MASVVSVQCWSNNKRTFDVSKITLKKGRLFLEETLVPENAWKAWTHFTNLGVCYRLRQGIGPPQSGAGVGAGMLRGAGDSLT